MPCMHGEYAAGLTYKQDNCFTKFGFTKVLVESQKKK